MKNSLFGGLGFATCLLVGLSAATQGQRKPIQPIGDDGNSNLNTTLGQIQDQLSALQVLSTRGLVPFRLEIAGGLADSGAFGTSNPEIVIDSDGGAGHFVLSSVMIRSNVPNSGFEAFSLNTLTVNGTSFDTRTDNLIGPTGSGVRESADILGASVRVASRAVSPEIKGGRVPSEIVAENAGSNDVRVKFFARSDVSDLDVEVICITGWKRPNDTISATYLPGS